MESDITVLVNPNAGSGRASGVARRIAAALRAGGACVQVRPTSGPGDAGALAQRAMGDRHQTLVVVSGDGTLNEVVNGLLSVRDGIETPRLVVVPCGSCNDVARGLGVRACDSDLQWLGSARERRLDAARVRYVKPNGDAGQRYFLNVADLGLGGRAVIESTRRRRQLGGAGSFLYGALVSILHLESPEVEVDVDGTRLLKDRASFVVVANGSYFAGGMHIAPQADPSDGLLDVLVLRATSRMRLMLDLLPRVYVGAHLKHPRVVVARGKHVTVRSDARLPLEMDGELVGSSDAEFSMVPGAIRVLVPLSGR